jgi:hypothetical protein
MARVAAMTGRWAYAKAASDLARGDLVVVRRRRWWQFWRPRVLDVLLMNVGPIDDVTMLTVNGKRVL